MAVFPSECYRHAGGTLRQSTDSASAGYVRQESDLQDRRKVDAWNTIRAAQKLIRSKQRKRRFTGLVSRLEI